MSQRGLLSPNSAARFFLGELRDIAIETQEITLIYTRKSKAILNCFRGVINSGVKHWS